MKLCRVGPVITLALAVSVGPLWAQDTGTLTGTVVDAATGRALSGAQVHIPATNQGALTNLQGRYLLLNVPSGEHVVRVQLLGYAAGEQTVTVTAGGSTAADFRLSEQAIDVEGLVVTALGIERSERSLGYAVQNLDAERLAEVPQVNITSALQGKMAGVHVQAGSHRPGGGSRIVIRGESSFSGGGEPLWVIDGVPVSMETDRQTGPFPLASGNAGSRAMDIDMNNVEEISVLRGAAATALYGSRAAHGAIIVKTKSGQAGSPTRFTVNSRYEMQDAILEGKQTTYTAGREGFYCNGLPQGYGGWCEPGYYDAGFTQATQESWGPHKDSLSAEVMAHECPGVSDPSRCIRMADPREDFYQMGRLSETSLNATGGIGTGGSFNLGGTYAHHQGITPNTLLKRLNLNANVTLGLTDRLQSTTTVMFANSANNWVNEGFRSPTREIFFIPANMDIRKAWNDDGTPVMWGSNNPHYLWRLENEDHNSVTDRWIASQYFKFDILDNLHLSNRLGFDTYLDGRIQNNNERPWRTAAGLTSGSTLQERFTRTSINNDLVLSLNGTPVGERITLSGLAGFNILHRENDYIGGSGNDIIIPGLYNVYNFLDQNVNADLPQHRRLMGLYSQLTVDYADWAFLNLTARNDWSSTLPLENNSYFYPSASLGVVFTDALGIRNDWLDYGKIRLSVARVGSDAPPYRLRSTYSDPSYDGYIDWPFNGTLGFFQGNSLGNPSLKPESTTEYEVGTELRLLQGRARFDLSYYDKRSYDQIFSVPSSSATGFSSITRNAGDLRNNGWEATLHTVPFQREGTRWDLRLNWTKNTSKVVDLAPGVSTIFLAGYANSNIQIAEGYGYGVISDQGWQRNPDGEVLIDDDPDSPSYGWPLYEDRPIVIGEIQPDWLGNLYTSFRYGPFTASGLLSTVQGGDIFHFDLNYTTGPGHNIRTLDRGTTYTYDGVKASTGQRNDIEILRDEYYFKNERGGYLHSENYVESATATRLQEITLQYELPPSLLGRLNVGSAQLYLSGYNLHVWTDFTDGDPAGSNYGSENAGGSGYQMFVAPPLRSYSLGLRANF